VLESVCAIASAASYEKSGRPVTGSIAARPRYRMARSISSDPRNVYTKNLVAAYMRRSPPQMPMMKNIGTRTTSHIT
jgi:hypothetical protein